MLTSSLSQKQEVPERVIPAVAPNTNDFFLLIVQQFQHFFFFCFVNTVLEFSKSSRISHCSHQHLVELCMTPDASWKEESHHARGCVRQTNASLLRLVKVDAELFWESQHWNLVRPRDKNKQFFKTQLCFFICGRGKQTWLIVSYPVHTVTHKAGCLQCTCDN